MRVEFYVTLGLVGCKKKEILECNDDTSDAELDEMLHDWMCGRVDCGWERVE